MTPRWWPAGATAQEGIEYLSGQLADGEGPSMADLEEIIREAFEAGRLLGREEAAREAEDLASRHVSLRDEREVQAMLFAFSNGATGSLQALIAILRSPKPPQHPQPADLCAQAGGELCFTAV